jgi:hypothetical protein
MTGHVVPRPEFSRPVAIDAVSDRPLVKELAANAEERAALARRFGLVSLDRFEASLELRLERGLSAIRVRGRFEADLVQSCVVTLAPVPARLVETVDLLYSPGGREESHGEEVLIDVDQQDPPETIGPGGLDLGEALAQQLAVALDPYPRAEGADVAALEWSASADAEADKGPFAVLAQLRRDN